MHYLTQLFIICSPMPLPPPQIDPSWKEVLNNEWPKHYMSELADFLSIERSGKEGVYPPKSQVFSAFNYTPFNQVKVVIMGQDPYHGPGQAHGLSFSVPPEIPQPPSLKNIFKELEDDLGYPQPKGGSLISWAQQGVLLLNAILTVRAYTPKSHYGHGWEEFTDAVIRCLVEREDPVIFVLWGKTAQEKCRHFLNAKNSHFVLTAAHPSPYSAYSGFFGCKHFSKINELLKTQGKEPINWKIHE